MARLPELKRTRIGAGQNTSNHVADKIPLEGMLTLTRKNLGAVTSTPREIWSTDICHRGLNDILARI